MATINESAEKGRNKADSQVKIRNFVICILLITILLIIAVPKEEVGKSRPRITGSVLASVIILSQNAPVFNPNITNYTINQSSNFLLDVNCSDADGDAISYYENFTGFEINSSTGLINQTGFNQSFVGSNVISINCSDGMFNTSQAFVLTIQNINDAPILGSIGPQISTEGELFTLDVDATDIDNDTLNFSASTTLFAINFTSGLINFTPSLIQVGNYTINISVFDGYVYDYEIISFRIVRGPYCGDSSCGSSETCSSCSGDCGSCPSAAAAEESSDAGSESGSEGGESGSAGGAVSGLGPSRAPYYRCDEKWGCSNWGVCSLDGIRTRKCIDINKCPTKQKKPAEIEKCAYQPTCSDGIKNGIEDGIDCGGICQPCIVENCFDGIKNQKEEGVDCGGPCKPCEVRKFAKIPFIELPSILEIQKKFPWILVAAISILIALGIAGDRIYAKRIAKKEFEEYRKSLQKYRLLKRRLYKFIANVSVITIIASVHIYLFSDNLGNMVKYSWIPAIMVLFVPVAVSAFLRHNMYHEYKKRRKEERLKQTHKLEILQLIDLENKLLFSNESKLKDKVYSLASQHRFDEYPELYNEINPLYGSLSDLEKKRKVAMDLIKIDSDVFKAISELAENETLIKASKEYPEFMSILKIMEYIRENINLDNYHSEHELLDEIREVSKPHMSSVVNSDKKLVTLYNHLVDIHEYFESKHSSIQEKSDEISGIEREFTDRIKGMSNKAAVLEIVQKDADFASVYNNMVDLFNHYLKKQELSAKMRG